MLAKVFDAIYDRRNGADCGMTRKGQTDYLTTDTVFCRSNSNATAVAEDSRWSGPVKWFSHVVLTNR
jgi:hypothetical protein